jgi:hypothetical protein
MVASNQGNLLPLEKPMKPRKVKVYEGVTEHDKDEIQGAEARRSRTPPLGASRQTQIGDIHG